MQSICKVYKIHKWYYIRHPLRYFRRRFIGHAIVYSVGYYIRYI